MHDFMSQLVIDVFTHIYLFFFYDQLLTPFLAPLFSLEKLEGSWKFHTSNYGLVFLMTSPHLEVFQEPTQSHLIETEDAPSALSFKNLQGF